MYAGFVAEQLTPGGVDGGYTVTERAPLTVVPAESVTLIVGVNVPTPAPVACVSAPLAPAPVNSPPDDSKNPGAGFPTQLKTYGAKPPVAVNMYE